MPASDARVDAYVQKAQPFARPILTEVRALLPLTETIKWRVPFFLLDGRIFASMAAFKAHTTVNLWKAEFHSGMPQSLKASALGDLPSRSAFAKRVKASAATFKPPPRKPAATGRSSRPVRRSQ